MMVNHRMLAQMGSGKKYIFLNVLLQWLALLANITIMYCIALFIAALQEPSIAPVHTVRFIAILSLALLLRYFFLRTASYMGHLSSSTVKKRLRSEIYQKLLRLGHAYREKTKTSEIVTAASDGVDQLETYYGAYIPQLFYSLAAPVTLAIVVARINLSAALILFLAVPLIPLSIMLFQRWAKKLAGRYWRQYTDLGDSFLESLQGLTTLKIYQADGHRQEAIANESESFRRITMKVLTLQLNSITIMDLIAFGGAAVGVIVAILRFQGGQINLSSAIFIILLAADFFIPMRLLGSYFHVARNSVAAGERIFHLLDLAEECRGEGTLTPESNSLSCEDLSFSYDESRLHLKAINLEIPERSFTAVVGSSGSGKSTLAALLMGRYRNYKGIVRLGGISIAELSDPVLARSVTYVGFNSYLFKGTVRDNLQMANPDASEEQMLAVLADMNLHDFSSDRSGLDSQLTEGATNLSGGQRQRLALARAMLHDSPIYIFDEATSNIDVESERIILDHIYQLAKVKTVLLITHRLANAIPADRILVMQDGEVAESGSHETLLKRDALYRKQWEAQLELESIGHRAAGDEEVNK